jgi:AraC-like DNA-binding protein
MSLWILALGYYGIKQTPIFVPGVETLEASAPKSAPNRKPEALSFDEKDKRKLVQVLEQDKIYLKSKLTLQDLAIEVDVPAHQLSQLINREFGQNFFELINKYRVEEVKRKLKDPKFQHLTFLGIALESGFNSKASFNRIFKKSTGQTPNEYRKQVA